MKVLKKTAVFIISFLLALMPLLTSFAEESKAAKVTDGENEYTFDSAGEAFKKAIELGRSKKGIVMTLLADWTDEDDYLRKNTLTLSDETDITIDMNGFDIDRGIRGFKDSGSVFHVEKESVLRITDNSGNSECGTITGGATTDEGGAICLDRESELHMSNVNIRNCIAQEDGGAVYTLDHCIAEFDNVGFYNNRIYDNTDECRGGAVYSYNGILTFRNCRFEGNYSEDDGGAIYLETSEDVIIENCIFEGNFANENGGAIYTEYCYNTRLSNNTMTNNRCGELGGAICLNCNYVAIDGGVYRDNTAGEHGGGIYVDGFFEANILGTLVIENNTAGSRKSDLCLQDGYTSNAYLICALEEGSHVGIDSTDGSSVAVANNISRYQYTNYLFADAGSFSFEKTKTVKENFVGSAIGNGNIIFIIVCTVVFIVLAAVLVVLKRRRKGGNENG